VSTLRFELQCELDDGSTWVVVTDQRDMARWEVQPFGGPSTRIEEKAMVAMRFLAWSASTRQRLTTLPWEEFDAELVEAFPLDEKEGATADDDGEDPGLTAQSAEPSSRSRWLRGKV
jgi:hypothetical protein